MAWYIVQHSIYFHFSHDVKPLILSQLEALCHNKPISFQIQQQHHNQQNKTTRMTTASNSEITIQHAWLDCDINNYIFRRNFLLFQKMYVWEYKSHYDTTP